MKRKTSRVLCTLLLALPLLAHAQSSAINNAIRQYNDGNYAEAAFGFYDVAAFDPVIENRLKAEYYLAQSLQKMGLLRTAAFFYQAVMSQGPNHPYYLKSIEQIVEITEAIEDDLFLPFAVQQEYNAEFANLPPETLYKINYLVALTEFRRENPAEALSFLNAVPKESSYYAKALYLRGIIKTFQGREGGEQAIRDYEEILSLEDTPKLKYWELDNTKELAKIALARTHYTLGNYAESKRWYERVARYSTYWDVALFENGWASFMAGDVGTAMGSLHSLAAPQFSGSFQPEALILKGTVYFTACLYDETKKELATFDKRYKPMADVVSQILEKHQGAAEFPFYLSLVATPEAQPEKLPIPVRNFLLDNQRLKSLIAYLNLIDDEIRRVKDVSIWKGSSLQKEALTQLEAQRENNVKVTGRFIRDRLQKSVVDAISNFDGQAEILRFETSKAEKEMLESGIDPETRLAGQTLLRPRIPGDQWEYWSFDGEWWVDELGYYKYTLKTACAEQGAGGGE